MIIIAYFFLIHPDEYTIYKPDSPLLGLKETTFVYGCRIFATMATEGNLQSANVFTLKFTTHKNGVR